MSAAAVLDERAMIAQLLRDVRHQASRAAPDLADWLVHLDLEGKATRTLYGYERAVAPLLRAHPAKTLQEFTHLDINDQLRLVPARSRYISRSIYNRFFDWAANDPVLDPDTGEIAGFRLNGSPMRGVPRMSAGHRRPKDIFSSEEIALLESLPAPDGALWALLFGTGLRRGEARSLRRSHVNLDREPARLIVYHGKGDKDRIVPLPTSVAAAVADLELVERLERDDHYWYRQRYVVGDRRRRGFTPIGDTTFENWYRRGIDQAGVRYLNPHQTRHTYHWRLQELGLDLEERQLLMGHESPETTQRQYGRLNVEAVARKVAAL